MEPSIGCITLGRSTTFSGCLAAQTEILGRLFTTSTTSQRPGARDSVTCKLPCQAIQAAIVKSSGSKLHPGEQGIGELLVAASARFAQEFSSKAQQCRVSWQKMTRARTLQSPSGLAQHKLGATQSTDVFCGGDPPNWHLLE